MKVLAIVVTYNGAKWINHCFSSIFNSSINIEVLAIDNNSTDGTASIIKEEYPDVEVLSLKENLGFGKANNIGLNRVLKDQYDYAFLLNQDAFLEEDTLNRLMNIHKGNSEFGILSPIHLSSGKKDFDYNFSNYVAKIENNQYYSDAILGSLKDVYEIQFINAAAWLVSRQCIEKVGYFDPLFYHYGEDDNYCQRVLYHNFKIGIVPNCFIVHDRNKRKVNKLSEQQKLDKILLKHKVIGADINNKKGLAYLWNRLIKLPFVFILKIITFSYTELWLRVKEFILLIRLLPEVKKSRLNNIK